MQNVEYRGLTVQDLKVEGLKLLEKKLGDQNCAKVKLERLKI